MPIPSRADRAAVRDGLLKEQLKRNAESYAENGFGDHDADAAKASRAKRKRGQQQQAAPAGDSSLRVVTPPARTPAPAAPSATPAKQHPGKSAGSAKKS